MNRRAFVKAAMLAGAAALVGCEDKAKLAALRERARRLGAGLDCSDVSRLQPAEAHTREENQYRQHSEREDQFCLGCLNYQPPADESTCGTCKTVRGPINPDGWCKQWTKALT
ncbi:MAG TPA: high-potential iron-sulfur protein [Candidatus Polarisedimenticolaceae bacterium]|nr:high-potential iron-sulfur protein [Candidatus Polarisedimenticolaceae bacterium]